MNKNKNSVGRPKYEIKWPRGKFTFTDLEVENGVNPKTGKGKQCTTLTLRKGLKRELARRSHSVIVLLKDTFADPTSKKGLGRKQFVYQRRVVARAEKPVNESAPKAKDSVSKATKSYEALKAELLAPTPAVEITSPVAPIETPVAEVPPVDLTSDRSAKLPDAPVAEVAPEAAPAMAS